MKSIRKKYSFQIFYLSDAFLQRFHSPVILAIWFKTETAIEYVLHHVGIIQEFGYYTYLIVSFGFQLIDFHGFFFYFPHIEK